MHYKNMVRGKNFKLILLVALPIILAALPQSDKITYSLPNEVNKVIVEHIEERHKKDSTLLFYVTISKIFDTTSISLLEYHQNGSDFSQAVIAKTKRFVVVEELQIPVLFESDWSFSTDLNRIQNDGSILYQPRGGAGYVIGFTHRLGGDCHIFFKVGVP